MSDYFLKYIIENKLKKFAYFNFKNYQKFFKTITLFKKKKTLLS